MNRRGFLRTAGVAGIAGVATSVVAQDGGDFDTIRVPSDQPTIQDGVDAASGGDLVLVAPDTYVEGVTVTTPGITLRGRNRNGVVLDGQFEWYHGVKLEADGVAVENLTVRHYRGNAVYWTGVEGFRASFVTAYNNGYYGIYALESRDGRFEYSYASGHPDAGFYLGRNQPFEAVISNVVAEHNGVGYSGTNTGEELTIKDSIWRHNGAGIAPNTLVAEDPPQHASRIVGNVVYANGNTDAPNTDTIYPMLGSGIVIWGGNENLVADNVVDGHPNFGIAVKRNLAESSGNVIRGNVVRASEKADLALGGSVGENNRFDGNQFATSRPPNVQADASQGADSVTEVYEEQGRRAEEGDYDAGDWREQPEPGDLPTMPDSEAPPRPASKSASWED